MTRILRAKSVLSPKTPRNVGATSANAGTQKRSGSWHDPAQLLNRTRSKISVHRLIARNPLDQLSKNEVVDQFTNNPNAKFDPSRHPGTVKRTTSVIRMSVGKVGRGHQKVFKPNRQTLFGGKTLKRKQF